MPKTFPNGIGLDASLDDLVKAGLIRQSVVDRLERAMDAERDRIQKAVLIRLAENKRIATRYEPHLQALQKLGLVRGKKLTKLGWRVYTRLVIENESPLDQRGLGKEQGGRK